jgi:hypothetical protein
MKHAVPPVAHGGDSGDEIQLAAIILHLVRAGYLDGQVAQRLVAFVGRAEVLLIEQLVRITVFALHEQLAHLRQRGRAVLGLRGHEGFA